MYNVTFISCLIQDLGMSISVNYPISGSGILLKIHKIQVTDSNIEGIYSSFFTYAQYIQYQILESIHNLNE